MCRPAHTRLLVVSGFVGALVIGLALSADAGSPVPVKSPANSTSASATGARYRPPTGTWRYPATVTQVAAGAQTTCQLRRSNQVVCRGFPHHKSLEVMKGKYRQIDNTAGQLCARGAARKIRCRMPFGVRRLHTNHSGPFTDVTVGGSRYACGLRPGGNITCWGKSWAGLNREREGPFTAMSAGSYNMCALTPSGKADCWGWKGGNLDRDRKGPFVDISLGENHACALRPSGKVVCWGSRRSGQNADPAGRFRAISAGAMHTCALRRSGHVLCWGSDYYKQSHSKPGKFTAISAGSTHTCGIRRSGAVLCWGQDDTDHGPD